MGTRISQLPPKGANLADTDLLMVSEETTDAYISKSITGAEIIASAQEGLQPTLVSGTNIKTVNDTSLLGSGNVAVQPTLVSGTNIKTINGNTLLGSGDLVVGGGLTIGTTAITSGTVGRILFEGTGNVVQESANLFWDNTNGRLGIGTASPNMSLDIRTGNVGIGVTSNAGYKLDVNGTARVQSGLTISGQTANNYLTIGTGTGNAFFVWSSYFLGVTGVKFRSENLIGDPSGTATGVRASAAIDSRGYLVTDSIGIGTTTNTINASAIAQIDSTTKGFLPPRMTTTQRNAIASPASGLIVYDTTDNKHYGYNGTAWTAFY